MNQTLHDRVATLLVAGALFIYGSWIAGVVTGPGPGTIAIVILVLGFLASASAVVPGFAALLAGSRWYLAAASVLGLVALVAGILTVVNATPETLALLMVVTVALWAGATVRHRALGSRSPAHQRRATLFGSRS